jgi:hypothetical protein
MEVEWGPIARDVFEQPAIAVAFSGIKPGLHVRLHLGTPLDQSEEFSRSERRVVSADGSVILLVDVPTDHLCDRHLSLTLVDTDRPGTRLWTTRYEAESSPLCSVEARLS